ncbi:hypothetical protein GCM10011386_03550 [Parapedobacter defluvii]|uniref:DUF5013 domain-containing protein n=1 Tax=Parapedobacter defluvii TaxID=2045106 RepID=A0ABQ1L4J0_9SPHI|nr:DUF4998 domain-containing protein [Parapedobacter defluvii]GGC15062.1 hypothetical protein GCM10011386_03550 [Parapedobacter defluvii]
MDHTYEQYVQKGGRIYTERPADVRLSGGLNRIKISWPKGPDPSVVKARIFWNVSADSTEIPVESSMDTVSCMINNLPEGNYSFIIVTYDKEGNRSVPLEVFGSTYGEKYQARLLDRPVLASQQKRSGEMFIAWGVADTAMGAFATEIKYVNLTGDTVHRNVDAIVDSTFFQDYLTGTSYFYRTLFLPDSNALDTFRTAYSEQLVEEYVPPAKIELSSRYLKNFAAPFQSETYDGARWGTLKDWVTNDAMRNQGPAGNKIYGGYDNINNSGSFGLQKWGDGDPAIVNGKMYQTITLPAGDYEVVWTTDGNSSAVNRGTEGRYLVVAEGNTLPDVVDIGNALGSVSFMTGVDRFNVKVNFSLEEPTEVSIGILVNFTSGQQAVRAGALRLWGPDL